MDLSGQPSYLQDYADIWPRADKVAYSRTLEEVASARTRLERCFDPETVRQLIATATGDVVVGGPELAAEALRAGLIDEIQQFVSPAVVGGGTRFLPDDLRLDLRLLDEHRFANGVMFLRYGVLS